MLRYAAKVLRVVDGDTIYFDVDSGFTLRHGPDIQLRGLTTPEIVARRHWRDKELTDKGSAVPYRVAA